MNLTPVALMEGTYFAVRYPRILTITSVFDFKSMFIYVSDVVYSPNVLVLLLQNTVFGGKPMAPDYNHIPCAVFWYCTLLSLVTLTLYVYRVEARKLLAAAYRDIYGQLLNKYLNKSNPIFVFLF